jgi:hypothetical protein
MEVRGWVEFWWGFIIQGCACWRVIVEVCSIVTKMERGDIAAARTQCEVEWEGASSNGKSRDGIDLF